MWYDIFNAVLDKHAPIVTKRVKRDRQPEWFNNEIAYARKMREKYHKLGMWSEFKFWRNRTKHIIDESKRNFYSKMVKDSKASKDLWKCIHSLNPSQQEKPYELLNEDGVKTNNVSDICNVFNKIIDTSTLPSVLKNARVTPVFKAGEKFMATNYRPISVLPVLSKLLEKHVSKHLYDYLKRLDLLHPAQSGFRQEHSCQTALINIIDKWIQDMNDGNINLAVLLDFKKAFDVVDHDILCKKLEIYGFDNTAVSFFKSYLNERTQQVQIGNAHSEKLYIKYQRYYSKTGIQWSVYAKREDKDYHHVPTIIKTIVENRLQDPVGMNRKVLLDVNDPRRVSAVLAPTLPPSTADLVAQKISRFNKEDPEKTLDYSWTDGLMSV
ncbi:Hypothetical predicted protein [Mytilus galloprovincialis]|uniref:Reverse transcriptase domain-containing protein n=1 Tax=Mytilus galloprovincialis TaxID=29158 RepID=A0A8B6GV67_MYTGA|nr:Hypothetical predicted protein [Mytilus galloprovincialis]